MTLFILEQDEQIAKDLNMPVLFICWMRQVKDLLNSIREGDYLGLDNSLRLAKIAQSHYQDWGDVYWGGFKGKEDYYKAVKERNESGK